MNIEGVEKKLREADFFLKKMIEHDRLASRDKERFDFYLSAFLNAGRTVDWRLQHEQETIYPSWRICWDATLTKEQQRLIRSLMEDRNLEVHESGSGRIVKTENRELGLGIHKLADGTSELIGPPGVPPAIIQVPGYYFTIDDVERSATEACREYLGLLEQMVAKFNADMPTEIESEIDAE